MTWIKICCFQEKKQWKTASSTPDRFKIFNFSDNCELHEIITRGSQAVTWSTVIHNHGILDIISYTSYKHIQFFSSDQSARESGQNEILIFLSLVFLPI